MKTVVTESPAEASRFIRDGGIVAFPTETVYGLGADVFNEFSIAKVFAAKERPADNPLIAHVARVSQIERLAGEVPLAALKFIERFFPGPLTLVLPKADEVPPIATAGLETIGVRMPGDPLTREFLSACSSPVVAPSANISGKPSPTTWQAVLEDLDGRIDCVLKGEPSQHGLESTVVDCTSDTPIVLRPGAITLEQLREIITETAPYSGDESGEARSPGMKHKHYSPRANVALGEIDEAGKVSLLQAQAFSDDPSECAFIGIHSPTEEFALEKIVGTLEEYARELFEFFRECDRVGIATVICESVEENGIGVAVMDRIRRAARR